MDSPVRHVLDKRVRHSCHVYFYELCASRRIVSKLVWHVGAILNVSIKQLGPRKSVLVVLDLTLMSLEYHHIMARVFT